MALADALPPILDSIAGMSVEDVQSQIEQSPIAATISDPASLAAMLVKAAADPDYAATLMGDPAVDPAEPAPPNPV